MAKKELSRLDRIATGYLMVLGFLWLTMAWIMASYGSSSSGITLSSVYLRWYVFSIFWLCGGVLLLAAMILKRSNIFLEILLLGGCVMIANWHLSFWLVVKIYQFLNIFI